MYYVYLLRSQRLPEQTYVGFTADLRQRVPFHNDGHVPHTAKFRPWRLVTYLGFTSKERAHAFERYLKTTSGKAFSKKRLW